MSTKIFDAYRVPKNEDIQSMFKKFTVTITDHVAQDAKYLTTLHVCARLQAKEDLEAFPGDETAKEFLTSKRKSLIDHYIRKAMKKANDSPYAAEPAACHFELSFAWDDSFWYLKFFPNAEGREWMRVLEKQFPVLEDFHYQNQVDRPDDVSEADYKAREKKWEELIAPELSFCLIPRYTIFDAERFTDLLRKNWFKSKPGEDLYAHLAYKFDKEFQP